MEQAISIAAGTAVIVGMFKRASAIVTEEIDSKISRNSSFVKVVNFSFVVID